MDLKVGVYFNRANLIPIPTRRNGLFIAPRAIPAVARRNGTNSFKAGRWTEALCPKTARPTDKAALSPDKMRLPADSSNSSADNPDLPADNPIVSGDKAIVPADNEILSSDKALLPKNNTALSADIGALSPDTAVLSPDTTAVSAVKLTFYG